MTVFEGIVNGVTYGTVEEYNDAIQKAMASGEDFTASTKTYTVSDDEADDDMDNPGCDCGADPDATNITVLEVLKSIPDSINLDELGGNDADVKYFKEVNDKFNDEQINDIVEKCKKLKPVEVARIINAVTKSFTVLNNQAKVNITALAKTATKLQNIEENIDHLEERVEIINRDLEKLGVEHDKYKHAKRVSENAAKILNKEIEFGGSLISQLKSINGEPENNGSNDDIDIFTLLDMITKGCC